MDLLTAHAHFASRAGPPDDLPISVNGGCGWPAACTGLAAVSGWLPDAQTEADLDEALKHGMTLLLAEVVSLADVRHAVHQVIAELLAWGDRTFAKKGNRRC